MSLSPASRRSHLGCSAEHCDCLLIPLPCLITDCKAPSSFEARAPFCEYVKTLVRVPSVLSSALITSRFNFLLSMPLSPKALAKAPADMAELWTRHWPSEFQAVERDVPFEITPCAMYVH